MKFLATLFTIAILSACGGGGSGGSVPTPVTPPVTAPSFSIGGAVTGLGNAMGLTLVLGSETLPIAAGTTRFVFVNKVQQNGTYSVAIGSQPLGSTCTISNGAGTVSLSDVQSVGVNCTPVVRTGPYTVSTFAGDHGLSLLDGVGTAARIDNPSGLAKDGAGNLYVSDHYSPSIRKVSPSGVVTTLAGNGVGGFVDGAGTAAQFQYPGSLAVDANGTVYVADTGNNAIRKISPNGVVSTLVRNLADIGGIALDRAGNLYASISHLPTLGNPGTDMTLRKITPGGEISTVAGSSAFGFVDGTGTDARFYCPGALAMDAADNLYVADICNYAIRKLTPSGVVTTVVGGPNQNGLADGAGAAAQFRSIRGLAFDSAGNLFINDSGRVRKIAPGALVTTLAGSSTSGYADGQGAGAQFDWRSGELVVDSTGTVIVADSFNHVVRKVSPDGHVTTWLGQASGYGYVDATGTAARFNALYGVATDGAGNVYVADSGNYAIRKITPSGAVTTLAGGGGKGSVDATGSAARFTSLGRLAADQAGNVYAMDGSAIRKITAQGEVTTLQSIASPSSIAVDGAGALYVSSGGSILKRAPGGTVTTLASGFGSPQGVAVDDGGNVYVADYDKHAIYKVSAQGLVTTLAGGTYGYADGVGSAAKFSRPRGVAVDRAGNVYVVGDDLKWIHTHGGGWGADYYYGGAVRKISSEGVVTTIAGDGYPGRADGPGASAKFSTPVAVSVDAAGTVYVVEAGANAVRKVAQ